MRPQSPVPSPQGPRSRQEAAAILRGAADSGSSVRIVGGGTKAWGAPRDFDLEVSTAGLDRLVEHNEGDLTAVLEAGVPLARAQSAFAGAGQMLALDPPGGEETLGGVVASGDSGPLRSRYGGPRDLVVGITVILADGTIARAGGKVIKNVAGYDLGKLFTGSFGTLGLIVELAVRLHPRPERTATSVGSSGDSTLAARCASELAHAPLEYQSLDVRLDEDGASVLARFGGATAPEQADAAERLLRERGLHTEVHEDDADLWERQRREQRSRTGTVVRVSGLPSQLPEVLAAARRLGAGVVGRAPLGLSWVRLEDRSAEEAVEAVADLRRSLAPAPCVVLDAPEEVRAALDPWGPADQGALELMRRVKRRFDPEGILSPGAFVGGI